MYVLSVFQKYVDIKYTWVNIAKGIALEHL